MTDREENADDETPGSVAAAQPIQPVIDFLPPWSEASYKQRLRMVGYSFIIYLPVALLILVALGVFLVYFGILLWPMAVGGNDRPELYYWHTGGEHVQSRIVAVFLGAMQLAILVLFSMSFFNCAITNPGSIPDDESWQISDKLNEESHHAKFLLERKLTTGAIRTCARCNRVKPDRCHHCRLCDQCVLKMDHHCPWVANCVGFFNYKYFFLMVTYGMLALWLFMATFWMALVVELRDDENHVGYTFFVTVVYLLCGVLCIALTLFWFFHIHLITSAITTVEFCEKRTRTHDNSPSPYQGPLYFNLKAALGSHPLLWPFPCCKAHPGYRGKDDTGTSFVHPLTAS